MPFCYPEHKQWSGQIGHAYYFMQIESYPQNMAAAYAAQAHFEGDG